MKVLYIALLLIFLSNFNVESKKLKSQTSKACCCEATTGGNKQWSVWIWCSSDKEGCLSGTVKSGSDCDAAATTGTTASSATTARVL